MMNMEVVRAMPTETLVKDHRTKTMNLQLGGDERVCTVYGSDEAATMGHGKVQMVFSPM